MCKSMHNPDSKSFFQRLNLLQHTSHYEVIEEFHVPVNKWNWINDQYAWCLETLKDRENEIILIIQTEKID